MEEAGQATRGVEIGGEVFRTSLFSEAGRGGHFVLVNKKMQKAAAPGLETMVDLTVAPDLEERMPTVPPELAKLLKTERELAKWFAGLSESMRYEIGKWIDGVKGAEARQRRAEQMAERLMLTMEGEKIPPPILDVAFRRIPAARKGWNAMTRRNDVAICWVSSITKALRLARGALKSSLKMLCESPAAELAGQSNVEPESYFLAQPSR